MASQSANNEAFVISWSTHFVLIGLDVLPISLNVLIWHELFSSRCDCQFLTNRLIYFFLMVYKNFKINKLNNHNKLNNGNRQLSEHES